MANVRIIEQPEITTLSGGYALYVGFQGMMLRKYTFGEASA